MVQIVDVKPETPETIFLRDFGGYKEDMPETLQRFTELLCYEKDAGCSAAEEIVAELKDRQRTISEFRDKSPLKHPELNKYLFSTELNPPIRDQVHQNMDAPLSHYFIHTSLKSYFTGNYVFEKYSNQPIVDALNQGVRVIELDLQPCGKDDICVRPGWGLANYLKLQECLDSIKEHAFTPTRRYPVIITFKDDLKPVLQSKATQMIEDTFGDMVYHPDPARLGDFPSPEELRNKILISTRPPRELLYADEEDAVKTRPGSADQSYQSLISFHAVEPRGILREALTDKIERPGWYETAVISFTQTNFLRTRRKRKFQINAPYKPQRAWMHGAQMIALSRQDDKEKLWLMQGMFRGNGGCGYVKKPDFLLNESPSGVSNPTVDPVVVKTLKVKVYMGDGWLNVFKKRIGPLSRPDLYVMISIAGVPHDERSIRTKMQNKKEEKKKGEKNKRINNWIPTWGEEFTFRLTYPALALLSIQVYNRDVITANGFGGQTCLPVSELNSGIRAVPLYDEKGERYSSTMLLMRFNLESVEA